jgi:outer membrane protein OmpA-like peptidoglycan-associated protein
MAECNNKASTEVAAIPPPAKPAQPNLAFNWAKAEAVTGPGFAKYQDSLLQLVSEGKVLRIEGRYYPGEAAPEGFENMGLARAASIAALFKPPLTDAQLELSSKLVTPAPNPIPTGLFASQRLYIADADKPVELEATEEEVTIYFPYGSDQRLQDPKVDSVLTIFVATQQRTGRSVSVQGHTDSDSKSDTNMRLSKKRANAVRQLLIGKGVPGNLITAEGFGEDRPKATNSTKAGKALNRRVEVKLLP